MTMQAIPRNEYKQQSRRIPRSLGFAGYTLSFDGVDDYVEVPDDTSLDITDAITIEFWMNVTNVIQLHHMLVSKGFTAYEVRTTYNRITVHWTIGEVSYMVGTSPGTILPNTWYHIVVTYSGSVFRIYINGVVQFEDTKVTGPIAVNTKSVNIGRRPGLADHLINGFIDRVKIYNQALSAEEIKRNMLNYHNPVRGGLVLWLPMEEGTGEVVYDKSGYGNNGTLLPAGAGPTWQRLRQWELRSAVE